MTGVANAAAVAIDNSKLYREAQEANRLKDEFVADGFARIENTADANAGLYPPASHHDAEFGKF